MIERYIIPERMREIMLILEFEKLGGGFAFPLQITEGGTVKLREGTSHVMDCVKHIAVNEHEDLYGTPSFGGNVPKGVFGVFSTDVLTLRESNLKEAIETWEPRVVDIRVTAGKSTAVDNESKVTMLAQFGVQATGTNEHLYFPVEEGE